MSKIQNLLHFFPPNAVLTSYLLSKHGYTPQLMKKYLYSGWVEKVGVGAYKRAYENVTWEGALWSLMQEKQDLCIAGRTALEVQGYEHFLSLGKRTLYISHQKTTLLPKWLKTYDLGVDFVFIRSDPIEELAYINYCELNGLKLRVSSLELAALEVCAGIPKYYTYESALYFFESLSTLRSEVVHQMLEQSTNIKAKRLFLHFADHLNHQWFRDIDLLNIDLGSGKRQIVKEGKLDSRYLITVPKNSEFEH